MSYSARVVPPQRKSSFWTVLFVILVIIVIIILILAIVLRPQTSTTPTTCLETGCSSGLFCNTTTGACVQCLTNSNCSGGNICTANKCVVPTNTGPECAVDNDCAQNEICSTGTCIIPASCTNNSQCNQAISEECIGNSCLCRKTAPIIIGNFGMFALVHPNGVVAGQLNYTFSQPNTADLKDQYTVRVPISGEVLFTSSLNTNTGYVIVNSEVDGIPYYPNESYDIRIKMFNTCLGIAGSDEMLPEVFFPTTPLNPPSSLYKGVYDTTRLKFTLPIFVPPPFDGLEYKMGVIVYGTSGYPHPNLAPYKHAPVALTPAPTMTYEFPYATFTPPPPVPNIGDIFYVRIYYLVRVDAVNWQMTGLSDELTMQSFA